MIDQQTEFVTKGELCVSLNRIRRNIGLGSGIGGDVSTFDGAFKDRAEPHFIWRSVCTA